MKVDRNHDEQPEEPIFSSLDEMCEAWGIDDATKNQMRIDMELTRPRDVDSETLH